MVMAKRVNKIDVLRNAMTTSGSLVTNEDKIALREVVANAAVTRASLMNKLIDTRRDIDLECGYPKELTTEQYRLMYDREGLATRVVSIWPQECWADDPEIVEEEDGDETDFEEAFRVLEEDMQVWSYLYRVDRLSGIGRFGVLLLGFDDGQDLNAPVEKGEGRRLLYMRAFDESLVTIKATESDRTNERYGQPTLYSIKFEETVKSRDASGEVQTRSGMELLVHWTRVLHVADNRESSEVYGVPRMQTLFNRLYDLRKIVGGSGEMFWKGAFPGYSFEMDPNARALTTDQNDALKEEIANYANGLQRYLTLQGITAKSLSPQIGDPKSHVETQLEVIAIVMGVPTRIFMGSEQAKLASVQDAKAWNKRIKWRQNKYLSPYVIKPFVQRMMEVGVLPEVEAFRVVWSDLDSLSEGEQAEVLSKQVEAFAKYVGGGVDALIPPEEFLTMFAQLDAEQVKQIMDAALEREAEMEEDEEERRLEVEAEAERMAAEKERAGAAGNDPTGGVTA